MIKISEELLNEILSCMRNQQAIKFSPQLYFEVKEVYDRHMREKEDKEDKEDTIHLRLNLMNESLDRMARKYDNYIKMIDKSVSDLLNDIRELHDKADRHEMMIRNNRDSIQAVRIHISELSKGYERGMVGFAKRLKKLEEEKAELTGLRKGYDNDIGNIKQDIRDINTWRGCIDMNNYMIRGCYFEKN